MQPMRWMWAFLGLFDAVLCGSAIRLYMETGSLEAGHAALALFILILGCAAVMAFDGKR